MTGQLPLIDDDNRWAITGGPDAMYRYELGRTWGTDDPRWLLWVMLNPSTGDGMTDDPTLRRVRSFTKREGYNGFVVVNLYAYRSPKPDVLAHVDDPVGPMNWTTQDRWLADREVIAEVVVGWGAHLDNATQPARHMLRADDIVRGFRHRCITHLRAPMCLGTAKGGAPLHPLMLHDDTPMIPWLP